jgi:hypothetical protein
MAIAGISLVAFGPMARNRWLHGELFSAAERPPRISYRTFERIGLAACIGVLAVIAYSLVTV